MSTVIARKASVPRLPWFARLVLVDPESIALALERIRATGRVPDVPNPWQIFLGVLRMWHRLAFRSETIGTSSRPVRRSLRAKLLALRPVRFPFLLRERAIAPLDFSGLLSNRERVISHLMGAHHDENQFVYDLEMLSLQEGALEELRERVHQLLASDTPRARFLRDLVAYDGYHESLAEAVEGAMKPQMELSEDERRDPDISFFAYLAWCARQPPTPTETIAAWHGGRFGIAEGVRC